MKRTLSLILLTLYVCAWPMYGGAQPHSSREVSAAAPKQHDSRIREYLTSERILWQEPEARSTSTVGFETNKDQVTAVVADGIDWLEASIEGSNVVLKSLLANDTGSSRDAVVTVTAGLSTNSTSATITVT